MARTKRSSPTEESSLHIVENVSDARSRASSLVSTSTRFTTNTNPPPGLLRNSARQDFVMVDRPTSLFSIGSQPLPPYSPHADDSHQQPPSEAEQQQAAPGTSSSEALDPHLLNQLGLEAGTDNEAANAVASHYRTIVQVIDRNHLAEISRLQLAHAQEIGSLRTNIDQTYRREFRSLRADMESVRQAAAASVERSERDASSKVQKVETEMRRDMETVRQAAARQVERSERERKARVGVLEGELKKRDEEGKRKEAEYRESLERQRGEVEERLRSEYGAALVEASQTLRKREAEWEEERRRMEQRGNV